MDGGKFLFKAVRRVSFKRAVPESNENKRSEVREKYFFKDIFTNLIETFASWNRIVRSRSASLCADSSTSSISTSTPIKYYGVLSSAITPMAVRKSTVESHLRAGTSSEIRGVRWDRPHPKRGEKQSF
ncbi:hypothetical protein TNCV_3579121 [Trichonephila clavipes]|nr:hypothetical protein TNCV_3579121 [Trichonephila clavipes]